MAKTGEFQAIQTMAAPAAIGPYSQAIAVDHPGRWVFLSGQVALDPVSGVLLAGDVAAQTERAMLNLQAVLREAGGDLRDLVKVGIFLADINDFVVVNQVYSRFVQQPYPARATVQVARLPRDAAVEIDGIAWIASPPRS